jgi:hypothetical protein
MTRLRTPDFVSTGSFTGQTRSYCSPVLFDSGSRLVVLQSKLVLEKVEELGSLVPNSDASVGICQEGNVDSDFPM